jgi:hypothetical protein
MKSTVMGRRTWEGPMMRCSRKVVPATRHKAVVYWEIRGTSVSARERMAENEVGNEKPEMRASPLFWAHLSSPGASGPASAWRVWWQGVLQCRQ